MLEWAVFAERHRVPLSERRSAMHPAKKQYLAMRNRWKKRGTNKKRPRKQTTKHK